MWSPAKSLSLQRRRTRLTSPCCSSLPKDQPAHTLPLHSTSLSWNQPLQGGSSTRADSGCSPAQRCLPGSEFTETLSMPFTPITYWEPSLLQRLERRRCLCLAVSFLPSCSCKHRGVGKGVRLHLSGGGGSKRGGGGTMPCLKCGLCSQIQLQLGRQPLKHPFPWLW